MLTHTLVSSSIKFKGYQATFRNRFSITTPNCPFKYHNPIDNKFRPIVYKFVINVLKGNFIV